MIAPINPEPSKPEGGGGELFARADNLRSDAKLASRMISLGVVTEGQIDRLFRKGMRLAGKRADAGDARGYAACMSIPIAAARLAQNERHKLLDKLVPDQHEHLHSISELRQALVDARQDREYVELERSRAIEDGRKSGANGHNGHAGPLDNGPAPRFG